MDKNPNTLTVPQAARILGIGLNVAYDAARKGQIPTLRMGKRRLVVPRHKLEAILGGPIPDDAVCGADQ